MAARASLGGVDRTLQPLDGRRLVPEHSDRTRYMTPSMKAGRGIGRPPVVSHITSMLSMTCWLVSDTGRSTSDSRMPSSIQHLDAVVCASVVTGVSLSRRRPYRQVARLWVIVRNSQGVWLYWRPKECRPTRGPTHPQSVALAAERRRPGLRAPARAPSPG